MELLTDYLPPDEQESVQTYLSSLYANIFTPAAIEAHERDYIGTTFTAQVLPAILANHAPGSTLLDIGCGFGTFVLQARHNNIDAYGVEIADYEIAFAKRRLARVRPQDSQEVYIHGDARLLKQQAASYDAITLWNVLEHIPDAAQMLSLAHSLLKPEGVLYMILPNYLAFRKEAHYLVPWFPLLPRTVATYYLRLLKRDPWYFEQHIHYRTNWGILWQLYRLGMIPYDLYGKQSMCLAPKHWTDIFAHPLRYIFFYNPFKDAIVLAARKREAMHD